MTTKKWRDIAPEMTPERRARIDEIEADMNAAELAYNLAELRKSRGLTQAQLAEILDKTQPSIAQMENAADNKLFTLHQVVRAMGGALEVTAVFPEGRVPLAPAGGIDHSDGPPQLRPV